MRGMKRPYALMWSGGKDSALALHRAQARGLEIARLVSYFDEATGRVRFHATRVEMLRTQAGAARIELHAIASSWPEMDRRLREELASLRETGFAGVVMGDIHLADVRAWYEERIVNAGLEHVEPLWAEPPAALLREFVETGGRAIVTCVDTTRLDRSWLGRVIDRSFVDEIGLTDVDPCGENGEYHSFVFESPVFTSSVAWKAGDVRDDGRFVQLDVLPTTQDGNQNFRDDVALSRLVDPETTLRNLAQNTGASYEDVVHHALVRYASSGAEALLAIEPWALRQLIEARKAGDWEKVGALIDWLEAGL